MRRVDGQEAAKDILTEGITPDSQPAPYHYNLACNEWQLGVVELAKVHFAAAFRRDDSDRQRAQEDYD